MDYRVRNINLWLQDETTDVNTILICGMSGIGKSTIAKYVYNRHCRNFDACSFLAFSECSKETGNLVNMQEKLLFDVTGRKENISCVDQGIVKIQRAIHQKRVLLVLDDVDQNDQLEAMSAIWYLQDLFYLGSKIIVTSRNDFLLKNHKGCKMEKVELLHYQESLELFSWYAFRQEHPLTHYLEISKRVIHYCEGLPLALQILGSSLFRRSLEFWDETLQMLKVIPDNEIVKKLRISFDCLQEDDKNLFLDIVCFFVGRDMDLTIKVLKQTYYRVAIGIQNLIDRSLIVFGMDNILSMHQLLQEMGKGILYEESIRKPLKRSRLWNSKDSFTVLREKTGTNRIEGMRLNMHKVRNDNLTSTTRNSKVKRLETNAFAKMRRLKLLLLNEVELVGGFEGFPEGLLLLQWDGFQEECIPIDFPMEKLVVLEMRHSNLKQVWKGSKIVDHLKVLDLSYSKNLTKTLKFVCCPNLERLVLEGCSSLIEIHESIWMLGKLILLNLKNCKNLRKLPRCMNKLKNLEIIIFSGSSISLGELSSWTRELDSLKEIDAGGLVTYRQNGHLLLPWTFWPKRNNVVAPIFFPSNLVKLSLMGCNLTDDHFPIDFTSLSQLEHLNLSETLITTLPESVRVLTSLKSLDLYGCKNLRSVVGLPLAQVCQPVYRTWQRNTITTEPTSPIEVKCLGCYNLEEVEDCFKLEPIGKIDLDVLKEWGFLHLESIIGVKIAYFNMWPLYKLVKKLHPQRLHESGVYSYFLPGCEIPSGFNLKTKGSVLLSTSLSFVMHSSYNDLMSQGLRLMTCCVYRFEIHEVPGVVILISEIANLTKRIRWKHIPTMVGCPRDGEEMLWVSHWNFGTKLLEDGDKIRIHVTSYPRYVVSVRELAVKVKKTDETSLANQEQFFYLQQTVPLANVSRENEFVEYLLYQQLFSPTVTFPRSLAWRLSSSGAPCSLPAGLKCGPA